MPRRLLNESEKYVKNAMSNQMQGTMETRMDALMKYNTAISDAALEEGQTATVEEFMKGYVFSIDDYIAQFTTLVQIARDSSTDGNIPDDTMNANNIMNKIGGHGTNNRNKKKHSEVVKNNKVVVEQDEKKINPSAMNNK